MEKFKVKHADWIKNATIYEVYIRQYTPEGTLNAFAKHLPRLKKLGVDILWLMPIQPIGEEKRKGKLGSPYSIKDYLKINPDLGTMSDFKNLVEKVHNQGMYIIIDWVANHTSWDNTWINEHPEFYTKDEHGNIISPRDTDWFDVAHLNYGNPSLRKEMINALKFWLTETNIDGFRCDMAGLVPTDFWEEARYELDKVKPIFMLAEAEQADLLEKAFDTTYNWAVHHLMNDIANERKSAWDMSECFKYDVYFYSPNAIRMYFTSNHDENKNAGSALERLGNSYKAFTLLTYTVPGMPLIFSGQEAGLNRRLDFFDKDLINWQSENKEYEEFYTYLNNLRKKNKALWSGYEGGEMVKVYTNDDGKFFAFTRKKDDNEILVVMNLTNNSHEIVLNNVEEFYNSRCVFSNYVLSSNKIVMPAWGYNMFIK